MSTSPLTQNEVAAVQAVAAVLIPGGAGSPPAGEVPGYETLLQRAATSLGTEADDLRRAIAQLPSEISWDAMSAFASEQPAAFELVSTTAAGAYFMSPEVLDSLGYPRGARSAPRFDLAAEEIESGILEPVIDRGSRVRLP